MKELAPVLAEGQRMGELTPGLAEGQKMRNLAPVLAEGLGGLGGGCDSTGRQITSYQQCKVVDGIDEASSGLLGTQKS